MATLYVGSAKQTENYGAVNGSAGDQLQKTTPDYSGEVSQEKFYVHKLGWYVLRPKSVDVANKIASAMIQACNNANIGYDQNGRLGVITYGTASKTKTECDCSSLVRQCVKEASGKDAGNFTTATERSKLLATGLFEDKGKYTSTMTLYNGDVLVTCTKGHTVVVTQGNSRSTATKTYYKACAQSYTSIVDALKSVGESRTNLAFRQTLASVNGVKYNSSYDMNTQLLALLKAGKLIKA